MATVIELLGKFASFWGRLNGPLIPVGTNYASAISYTGFLALFNQFCAEEGLTAAEITEFQNGFAMPVIPSGTND